MAKMPALAPTEAQLPAATPAPKWHDVTIVKKKSYSCARAEGVPPEEFGISRHARNVKDCGYCYHEVLRRQSELLSMGYDAEQVKKLPSYTSVETEEQTSRDTVEESQGAQGDEGLNESNRLIKITEHYVSMDYEGNGKACYYCVTTGGDQGDILKRDGDLEIYQVECPPFAAMTPVIVTHRFFGRSIADLVMDIQRIKTALVRGILDNLYLHNNPRVEVASAFTGDNTLDDLLVSRPGGIIRTKQPGGLNWQTVPDITGSVYPALQYFDATREWRTGVTRQGQGVDPNALQNQVATIANQMHNAAQAKMKLIARIFAETGVRDLFSLLHGTIRKNGSQAETVRLRNQWVSVDPRDWKERNDMTINVGLGTGTKPEQLAEIQLIVGAQEKAIQAGMVSKKNLFNSAKELVKITGRKDPDSYFTPPGQPPDPQDPDSAPIQPPEDPKVAEGKQKLQLEQAKAQADVQLNTQKNQADQQMSAAKMEAEAQLSAAKIEAEAQLKREQMQQEFQLKIEQMRAEFALKREEMAAEMQLRREQMVLDAQVKREVGMAQADAKAASVGNVEMGGEVG